MALLSAGIALASPASADQGTDTLAGTSPAYATAAADQGQTAAATPLTLRVFLNGKDDAAFAAYAKSVSDPNSALYKHFLNDSQFQARFGTTQKQIDSVTAWLKSSGLTVTSSTSHWLDVQGSAAAVQTAFGTQLHNYVTPQGSLHAPQHDVKVPKGVSSAIAGVSGLAQATSHAVTMSRKTDAKPNALTANDPSCSAYFGEKAAPATLPPVPAGFSNPTTLAQCSVFPKQLRDSYGVTATGLSGKGATIAIVNWYGSSTMEADANQYAVNHGDAPFRPGQYSEVGDPSQWTNKDLCGFGSNAEEALDIEMAHGMAPDAKVIAVQANSCFDSDLQAALANVVDKHLADIVSNSWGEGMFSTLGDIDPATIAAYNKIFMKGAVVGIAFDFSSGDCMNNDAYSISTGLNCDTTVSRASVDWPTSSEWVTSVGGTALGLNKKGGYSFETPMADARSGRTAPGAAAWNPATPTLPVTTFGAGGGVSELTAQPWYQTWTVPNKMATTLMDGTKAASPRRTIPDISLNGDLYFSSTLVGQSDGAPYSEAGFGGTSVSAPMWAGILADAQQAQWGIPVGFANPAIYFRAGLATDVVQNPKQIGNTPVHSVIFEYPATSPFAGQARLIQYGKVEGLPALRGYDLATGVGSPNALFIRSFGFGR